MIFVAGLKGAHLGVPGVVDQAIEARAGDRLGHRFPLRGVGYIERLNVQPASVGPGVVVEQGLALLRVSHGGDHPPVVFEKIGDQEPANAAGASGDQYCFVLVRHGNSVF